MTSQREQEVLEIFRRTGALLTGHFVLRSGLHSGGFFQCAQVCQFMPEVVDVMREPFWQTFQFRLYRAGKPWDELVQLTLRLAGQELCRAG